MISQGSKIYYLRWAAGHILKDKYDNDTLNPQATMEESLFEKDTVTDYEGNDYNTVKIGQQWWMAENLKATKYNDGTSIPLVTNAMKWQKLTSPAYCWYNNDISHKDRYGALYNWYTVNTGNLCPSGWHVPTRDEWAELLNYVGIKTSGDKLRETGSKHWRSPGVGETNPTGFTALPGGEHTNINNALTFRDMRFAGYWWSATLADSPQDACNSIGPRNLLIEYNSRIAWLVCALEEEGLSVRCVKDRN
jgi:uncharacterized protein (TIGR02145 family)